MTQYRWIAADRSTNDGVEYWRLMLDVVGGGEGELMLALDPLPPPFHNFDRERSYSEDDPEVLRGTSK
jgi:hypothetical protein